MSKILVTGSNGFLGRALLESLINHDVITFDADDGNVIDYFFTDKDVSHVFHLAARTSVPESWEIPYQYYQTNIMGTVNVLELCRTTGAKMTYVTTYPYGEPQYIPIDESHPCNPNSPYNHSKHIAEDICRSYSNLYGVSVTVLRLFNVYGNGQSESFLIPHVVKQAVFSSAIEVMDLEPKRDYVHITDVVKALLATIGVSGYNIYNVASGESRSVMDVCRLALDTLQTKKAIISLNNKRKNEVSNIEANISKIKKDLGWTPTVTFPEGIKSLVEYYRSGLQ